MFVKKSFLFLSLIIFVAAFSTSTNAKSVYAITDHGYYPNPHPSKITSYDINSTGIDINTTYTSGFPTGDFHGPVGVADLIGDSHLFF